MLPTTFAIMVQKENRFLLLARYGDVRN